MTNIVPQYDQGSTGAVNRPFTQKLQEMVSVFDFMTTAQISAVQAYTFVTDVTTALQTAMDTAWSIKADLFIPSGGYLVTGLTLPGTYPTLDQRDHAIRIYGQGYGNPFAMTNTGGTVIKSVTNAPIFVDRNFGGGSNAQGTYEIDHIRFDGTSSTPVVQLYGFYGISSFYNNVIYQRGVGDGIKILYGASVYIHENYVINSDYVNYVNTTGSITSSSNVLTVASGTGIINGSNILVSGAGASGADLLAKVVSGGGTTSLTLAASASTTVVNAAVQATPGINRTGTGFNFPIVDGGGLVTFYKNTSRGFFNGYVIGSGLNAAISTVVEKCECSSNYNGVVLTNTQKAAVKDCYFEGGDGGTGILDNGNYSVISNNILFAAPGYFVGIDASNSSTTGTMIENNSVNIGINGGGTCIKLGGNTGSVGSKSAINNFMAFTDGTANCTGLLLTGNKARFAILGNFYSPSTTWTGYNSYKLVDNVTSGSIGLIQQENGNQSFANLAQGALSLLQVGGTITASSVSGYTLTIGSGSNFYVSEPTTSINVLRIVTDNYSGRIVMFRCNAGNKVSFGNSAYISMAGGVSFNGGTNGGVITFLIDQIGGANYAFEIARAVY
jgi:hypothetical protein